MLELELPSLPCERPKTRDASALTFDWFGWDICSVNTRTSSRRWRGSCSDCCAILTRRQGLLTGDKILSADCLGLVAQKKTNRYSRMVIFFLIQRCFSINSYYKSRMAAFRSRLVIMISHDSFSFSYSNFNFSYSDFRISSSDFPISHSDFSISHIDYWNSIGDFKLISLLSCLACHSKPMRVK